VNEEGHEEGHDHRGQKGRDRDPKRPAHILTRVIEWRKARGMIRIKAHHEYGRWEKEEPAPPPPHTGWQDVTETEFEKQFRRDLEAMTEREVRDDLNFRRGIATGGETKRQLVVSGWGRGSTNGKPLRVDPTVICSSLSRIVILGVGIAAIHTPPFCSLRTSWCAPQAPEMQHEAPEQIPRGPAPPLASLMITAVSTTSVTTSLWPVVYVLRS
jgi:hypothetical protein